MMTGGWLTTRGVVLGVVAWLVVEVVDVVVVGAASVVLSGADVVGSVVGEAGAARVVVLATVDDVGRADVGAPVVGGAAWVKASAAADEEVAGPGEEGTSEEASADGDTAVDGAVASVGPRPPTGRVNTSCVVGSTRVKAVSGALAGWIRVIEPAEKPDQRVPEYPEDAVLDGAVSGLPQ